MSDEPAARLVSSFILEGLCMLRILVSLMLVAVLAACQTVPPVDPARARGAMLNALGIDPSAVWYEGEVRYGIGSGHAGPVAFKSGLYVQTASDLYLFKRKEDGQALEQDVMLPLEKLQYAVLEPWSFTHLRQLQLASPAGLIAVDFHNTSDAMAGDGERAQAAYTSLLNAKVRARAPSGDVFPEMAVMPYTEVYPAAGAAASKSSEHKHD